MISIEEVEIASQALGLRLRARRIDAGQTQAAFAARIGVSVPTVRAMEAGRPTVGINAWLTACWALDRLADVGALLAAPQFLLDAAQSKPRRRAPRRPRRVQANAT